MRCAHVYVRYWYHQVMTLNPVQRIEGFHLVFLQVFVTGTRRERCILKGGTNLRYFFGSVRYSNDIDLDVDAPPTWQLEQAIDTVLASPALNKTLQIAGIAIEPGSISKPKQTATTHRWRLGLIDPAVRGGDVVRTTIECSSREDGSRDHEFAAVPAAVVRPYGVLAPTVAHYRLGAALEQKVAALAERSQTKARDVFDLDLLFRLYARRPTPPLLIVPKAEVAAERGLALTDDDFEVQVVPFLDPDLAEIYVGRWSTMREDVAEHLIELVAADATEPGLFDLTTPPSLPESPPGPPEPPDPPERQP